MVVLSLGFGYIDKERYMKLSFAFLYIEEEKLQVTPLNRAVIMRGHCSENVCVLLVKITTQ